MKLFEAIVIDAWKSKHHTVKQESRHYERELKRLEDRKARLIQMRMSSEISKEEFTKLKDGLDNQITSMQISKSETNIEKLELETSLSYAKQFIRNITRQWQDMKDVKQKQRLQRLVFPEGINYDKETQTFGTAVLAPIFSLNRDYSGNESDLVAGEGVGVKLLSSRCAFGLRSLSTSCPGSRSPSATTLRLSIPNASQAVGLLTLTIRSTHCCG